MVRLRLPGGRIPAWALRRLAELASAYGNGILQLTSRAGLQLRGLPDPLPTGFVDAIFATGLLPTTTHERVRNIVASPLTGLRGGRADLTAMSDELDRGLMAEPTLADLPGRFLFVLDDGRGDVIDLTFDLGYQAVDAGTGVVLVGSPTRGIPVRAAEAPGLLLRLARSFAHARSESGAWHVNDLPTWLDALPLQPFRPVRGVPSVPLGGLGEVASVAVPLARLTLQQARVVESVVVESAADDLPIVITPWRGLVLGSGAGRLPELAAAGLIVDDSTAWAQLSACVGAPFCAKARVDTTAVAAALAAEEPEVPRTHVSGCERRCGAPTGPHVDLVAPTLAAAREATRS